LCDSREQAEQVKAWLAAWLVPRGLTFNEDKTRIIYLDDGLDFFGFSFAAIEMEGSCLLSLIKPSKAAVKRYRDRSPPR
jgi:RNA-directed DNA polymerase